MLGRVFKAFFLHPGHIEHIRIRKDRHQVGIGSLRDAFLINFSQDLLRHAEDLWRNIIEPDVIQAQQARQRMDRASVLEVAHHGHRQTVNPSQFLLDGEQVQQSLGGVFADPIPGVDDRFAGVLGCQCRRTGLRVAQHDHIRVRFQGAHRIRQGFAFGD